MKHLKSIFALMLALGFLAACDDGGDKKDADADVVETPTEDVVATEDAPAEDVVATEDAHAEDVIAETEGDAPTDVPAEETAPCVDDATHIYIDVTGTVTALPSGTVEGLMVAAIAPLDALGNPTPTPLKAGAVAADGTFSLTCINVKDVALGLVILVDDAAGDGIDGTIFPTGTGIKAWMIDAEKVDITDAPVFALTNTLRQGLETMGSFDAVTNGFVMGTVVNGTTGAPLDAAVVKKTPSGTLTVVYPTADFSGVESDSNTSANGIYVVPGPLTLSTITAEKTDFTFTTGQAATKGGFCYFLILIGTPVV